MSLLHKKEKQNKNNDPLIRLMTPMIAGILVCVFCLVSMTWAWFNASVNTPTQTIQSATRSTSVKVYEVSQPKEGNSNPTIKLVKPEISEVVSLAEGTQTTDEDASEVMAGEPLVWNLSPEKSYEVVMTGSGTASQGYCKVALSYTASGKDTETKLYKTSAFEKEHTVKFTYNTGGFYDAEGVTATEWNEYVEKTTPPTLTIASYWGEPENETSQVSLMSLRRTAEEEIMLLSDGDVLGLAPIPCPEAKAETEVELEGFEIQEGAEISAEEDYKISLTLKEGYEMPSEVVVNIDGKDYVVSTEGAEASDDAPYYNVETGVLTVPSALLSDGIKVSVKATATPIPEDEPEEEETEEETTEETTEEESEETTEDTTEEATEETTDKTETTDDNETEEDNSADTSSGNNVVADNPNKKEENGEKGSDEPVKTPAGDGGNDDDDDEADNNSGGSSNGNASSSNNNEEETEDEKADVKLNLSQLTINLEETQIPTNADLVLTLSAKEDMELPKQIVITLDKTIRDEDIDDEDVIEDKTEYIINTDGKDNPEGFEFDAESGELTISSELLEGVREITIADTEENEADKDEEKATLTFEVKNLTFDFTDDEIVTDEDVVITFTAGEGYELPETIVITIDGVEYVIYTSEEDSDKNPDGITFDIETGTLTISKDLLSDAEAITIAAEGVEKEDEESKEENPDADKKDESEDKDNTDKENGVEGGETTDKETEGGTDTPNTDDNTETEGGTDTPGGENTEVTNPETNPDDTTESEDNDDSNGEDNGEDEGKTETLEPDTEVTTLTTPDTEDNTNTEQDGENAETEKNGEGSTENGAEETNPDTESGSDDETTTPTEPTTPAEPNEPAVSPETPKTETPNTSEPTTGGNDGDGNGEAGNVDNASSESSDNSGNDSSKSNASSESASSTSPSVTPSAPTTSAPTSSETSTPSASTQTSGNSSSTSASSTPASSTNSNSNGASQASGTTTPSGSKETSSEE